MSDEEVIRLEMYALRVPQLLLPIRHYSGGGNPNAPGGPTSTPAPPFSDPPPHATAPPSSSTTAPATGSAPNATTTQHGPQTDELLDLWYPHLQNVVCAADDASVCSGYESEEQDSINWMQYARLFAGSSAELQRVVVEHDAVEERARDEKVGRWLRGMADVSVR